MNADCGGLCISTLHVLFRFPLQSPLLGQFPCISINNPPVWGSNAAELDTFSVAYSSNRVVNLNHDSLGHHAFPITVTTSNNIS